MKWFLLALVLSASFSSAEADTMLAPRTYSAEQAMQAAEDHAFTCKNASFTADATIHNVVIAGSCPTNAAPAYGALTANVVETLPSCTTALSATGSGRTYGLKKMDSSSFTVSFAVASGNNANTGVADTIDGAASVTLPTQYGSQLDLQCDGYGHWIRDAVSSQNAGLTIAAAGTTQAAATVLTADFNEVTSATSGSATGVLARAWLSIPNQINRQEIVNTSGTTINIWPPTGAAIWNLNGSTAAGSTNAAVTLANGSHATIECKSATLCYEAP